MKKVDRDKIRTERDKEIAGHLEDMVLNHIEDDDNRLSTRILKNIINSLKKSEAITATNP